MFVLILLVMGIGQSVMQGTCSPTPKHHFWHIFVIWPSFSQKALSALKHWRIGGTQFASQASFRLLNLLTVLAVGFVFITKQSSVARMCINYIRVTTAFEIKCSMSLRSSVRSSTFPSTVLLCGGPALF